MSKSCGLKLKDIGERWIQILLLCLDYLICFFIVTLTAGAWLVDSNLTLTFDDQLPKLYFILLIYLFISFIAEKKIYVKKTNIKRIVIVSAFILIYIIMNKTNNDLFLSRCVVSLVLISFWLAVHEDSDVLWRRLTNVVCILACLAFFFYIFGSIIHLIPEYSISERVWGGWKPDQIRNFYYLYYESQYIRIGDFILWRNPGIFAEAPMYNFVLCVSLGSELFLNKKPSRLKLIILVISIISTFSTTGFIYITLSICCYAFTHINKFPQLKFLRKHFKLSIGVVLVLLTMMVLLKLISPNGQGSMGVRSDHLWASLKTFIDYPLFGCGWSNTSEVLKYAYYKQGLSVGLPSFIAFGGLILMLIVVGPVLADGSDALRLKKYNRFLFEVLFLILFFFTIVNTYPILWFFVAYTTVNGSAIDEQISGRSEKNVKVYNNIVILMFLVFIMLIGIFRYRCNKQYKKIDADSYTVISNDVLDLYNLKYNIELIELNETSTSSYDNRLLLSGWAIKTGINSNEIDTDVVLKNNQTGEYYNLKTIVQKRDDVNNVFDDSFDYRNSGFSTYIQLDDLFKGEFYDYTVCLKLQHNGTVILIDTEKGLKTE